MLVVREDNVSVVISDIAWGNFNPPGESKNSQTILGCRICLKNAGNVPLVVAWNATGLDRSVWSITATWSTSNQYPENDYNQFRIDPGYVNGFVTFTLTLINPIAAPGDYSFTINFDAQAAP